MLKIKRFIILLQRPQYRTKLSVFILIGLILLFVTPFVKNNILQNIFINFLTTFLAVALIQLLWDFLGGDPIDTKLTELQANILVLAEISSEKIGASKGSGLIATFSSLPNDLINNDIVQSSHIRILQTWMGNFIVIEENLITALRNDCKVQILLLNPESPLAKMRAIDIGLDAE